MRHLAFGNMRSNDSLVCYCNLCGFTWISRRFIVCPLCGGSDYLNVPMTDHKGFTIAWLRLHGFDLFVEENSLCEVDDMLKEMEIKNWKQNEEERLSQIVDPVDIRSQKIVIAVLDGVLND